MFLSLVLLSCLSASSVKASLSVVTVAQIINAASNRSPARPGFFSREGWLVCNATTGAVTVSGDTTPVDIASDVIAANVELGTASQPPPMPRNIVEATVNIQNEGELFTIKTTLGAITHTFFAAQPIADGAPLSSFVQGAKNSIRQENNTIWQFNIKIHDVQQDTAGKVYALWTIGTPPRIGNYCLTGDPASGAATFTACVATSQTQKWIISGITPIVALSDAQTEKAFDAAVKGFATAVAADDKADALAAITSPGVDAAASTGEDASAGSGGAQTADDAGTSA